VTTEDGQVNYVGPDPIVQCSFPPCGNTLRRSDFGGPQFCCREHRDGREVEDDRKPIRLTGHASVMTERRGLFRVICGCGWTSDFAAPDFVEMDHDRHLAAVDRGEE
jgi:hypothetical protein